MTPDNPTSEGFQTANPDPNTLGGGVGGSGGPDSAGSAFDNFFDDTTTEALDTKYPVTPKGDFEVRVAEVKVRQIEVTDKATQAKRPAFILDTIYDMIAGADDKTKTVIAAQQASGILPKDRTIQIRGNFFLDVDPDSVASGRPRLLFGNYKNVKLGMLREAVGQNKPGAPWSLRMLEGAGPLLIRVDHDPDSPDKDNPYIRVVRWAAVRRPLAAA